MRHLAAVAAIAILSAAWPATLSAQGGLSTEGALFLLVPVGARTVGTGQTLAAVESGVESLWGNPAGIARATKKELSLHHSQTVVATGEVLGFVYPAGKAGVLGAGVQLFDYGAQEVTDPINDTPVGQLLPRSIVALATYAATLGPSLRAGVSFKLAQSQLGCSGPCANVTTFNSTATAVDAGVQWGAARKDSLTFGVAVRSLGSRLQVNDRPQADPLPMRLHLGAQAMVPAVATALPGAELRWTAEVVSRASMQQPALRVGAELGLQKQLYLRGGYASGLGEVAGAAMGLGFVRGRLALDFARVFGGFSSDAGTPPTYLTLRVSW